MELIEKAIVISLAICGLRIVSSKGMILYFLRMPYEWLVSEDKEYKGLKMHKIAIYILKPVIGCCTCMASVWTIIIEIVYFKVSITTLLLIFMVAAFNSILMALYEKLNK